MYKNKKIKSLEEKIEKNQKLRERAVEKTEKPFVDEFRKLNTELEAEMRRIASKKIGKCYVSTNRYLGGGFNSWNCYDKIIEYVSDKDTYKVLHFEKMPDGIKIEIGIRYGAFKYNYTEITNEEFNKAFEEIKKELP